MDAEAVQGVHGGLGEVMGLLAGTFQSKNGRIRGFGGLDIFAGSFAEHLGRLGDIKDVVDNLERQPEGLAENREFLEFRLGDVGAHGPQSQRGG